MAFFCIHCRSEIDPKFKACPFCGEPITDFLRKYLETPLEGKYQILGRLGVGGMGDVYKALHIHLNALRVIKLMRAQIAGDAGAHERFQREARLATRIQHPNVAALFDFDSLEDGSFYMVWEYIEGINLHELIDERGPLSPRYAARLAVQALHGLDAVHRAGIIHRDVSPENLMIARDEEGEERVKIIDLGIAKSGADDADNKTKTGMFVGKWKYCSPEHLGMLPEGERIDGRADIYSFGIVLYEMLTGVPPFQADTPHAYLVSHSSERPRKLREVNPTVSESPELEALIFRAMEKDRNKRFANAREFARAIEALIPSLGDDAGMSPKAVPVEVTAEATRVSPKPGEPQPEPVDARATTVQTISGKHLAADARTLDRVHPPTDGETTGKRPLAWVLGIAAAAIIAVVVMVMMRRQPPPIPPNPQGIVLGHVGINAFPWAEVKSIRNVVSGQTMPMSAPVVTPAPIDLAPGRYELTFTNPAFANPITKVVEVRAGEEQQITAEFADPLTAKLPQFEEGR